MMNTAPVPLQRRPWRRRACRFAVAFTLLWVLGNVGGNQVGRGHVIEHGWPFSFLYRRLPHKPALSDLFALTSHLDEWFPQTLAANLAIGALLVLVLTVYFTTWRHTNSRWWQFRLSDAVRLLLLLAAALGYTAWSHRQTVVQQKAVYDLRAEVGSLTVEWDARADWFWRPLGSDVTAWNADVRELFFHAASLRPEDHAQLAKFPRLRLLEMYVIEPPQVVPPAIANMHSLRRLGVHGNLARTADWQLLTELPRLRELRVLGARDADLRPIGQLVQLVSLDLSGSPDVSDAGLTHLVGLRRLKFLDLTNTGRTDEGIARLQAAIPDLQVTDD